MRGAALEALQERLRRVHRESGDLSAREVSKLSHGSVSHTTANQVLRGRDIPPSWRSLAAVVGAIGGNLEEFKSLWIAARDEAERGKSNDSPYWTYHEPVSGVIETALQLSELHFNSDRKKSADFLLDAIGGSSGHPYGKIDLVWRLYERFHQGRAAIENVYGKTIDNFIRGGDPEFIELASTAASMAERVLAMGIPHRALVLVHRARGLSPNNPGHMEVHGQVLLALGEYEQAEKVLIRSHEIWPQIYICRHGALGEVLKMTGKLEKLEEIIFAQLGNFEDAEDENARLCDYVHILIHRGKLEEAEKFQREALKKSPARVYDLIDLSSILLQQGKVAESINLLISDEEYEESVDLRRAHSTILAKTGRLDEAISILDLLDRSSGE